MRWFVLMLLAAATAMPQNRRAVILERARALGEFAAQQAGEAGPEVMEQAARIAGGTVFFYGRTPVNVGLKAIDWSGGHIRHQEWPAQLNRFFHLKPLAAAYIATGDERYARAARAYIEDWLRDDPYAHATTLRPGDNTLNMSIRLGTSVQSGWGGTLPVFLKSPAFDDAFVARVLDSISQQAEFLSGHLSPQGNWRIAQLDALVFTALRFPFLPNAGRLLETGITGMRNALATQFLPDGVHIERTPGYAEWMTSVAAHYVRLPQLFPGADARVDRAMLVRALDYAAQTEGFGVNDSTAPHRDGEQLRGLAYRAEVLRRLSFDAPKEPPLDQVFPHAGQVFMRTEWRPGADYVAFDASTWGGGHSHLSRLALAMRAGGRMLVADPGILNYEMSDPLAAYGKSTPAHSTLNLNGWNQSGADAQLLDSAFTGEAGLVHARYQGGYWPGEYQWSFRKGRGTGVWGEHDRILFWVKREYAVVVDTMTADAGADVRNCWQLGPMEKWSQDARTLAWWSENPDVNLLVQMLVAPAGTVMETFEGSRNPPRGWVGHHGNDAVAAPLVEFRYRPALSVMLLAPFKEKRPAYSARYSSSGGLHHLDVTRPDGSTDQFAWSNGLALPVDDGKPFVTDGTFVWQGAGAKPFVLRGSYFKIAPAVRP